MSAYEVEHNLAAAANQAGSQPSPSPSRPDLSSFFSQLEWVERADGQADSLAQPEHMAAPFRLFAEAVERMLAGSTHGQSADNSLLSDMLVYLHQNADNPPSELQGVPDSFLDQLERVPKWQLSATDSCPICVHPFLDDEYPLVVQLPCHQDHRFDLDCIRPWLKLNSSCPLDRKELLKNKQQQQQHSMPRTAGEQGGEEEEEEEEEDYDDMYA